MGKMPLVMASELGKRSLEVTRRYGGRACFGRQVQLVCVALDKLGRVDPRGIWRYAVPAIQKKLQSSDEFFAHCLFSVADQSGEAAVGHRRCMDLGLPVVIRRPFFRAPVLFDQYVLVPHQRSIIIVQKPELNIGSWIAQAGRGQISCPPRRFNAFA